MTKIRHEHAKITSQSLYLIVKVVASLLVLTACQSPSTLIPPASNDQPSTGGEAIPSPAEQTTAPDVTTSQPDNSHPANQSLPPDSIDQTNAFTTTSPVITGNINHPELSEVSGLAASTRRSNTLWAINDSGNQPKLYALKHTGESIGSFTVAKKNRDWEDLASAWINGESYLLIADIGDNQKMKDAHHIYIVPEPLLDNRPAEPLEPAYTLQFRYPDGAHDAESMAFADGWVYILTKEPQVNKKRQASQVFRVPLDLTHQSQLLVAEKVADLAIPAYSIESNFIASLSGLDISQPTAFDIDSQNRYAYVLTYRAVYRYQRDSDESWAQVLAEPRNRIHTHSLSQAEALAVGTNGVVWFTTEKRPAPMWALPGGPQ